MCAHTHTHFRVFAAYNALHVVYSRYFWNRSSFWSREGRQLFPVLCAVCRVQLCMCLACVSGCIHPREVTTAAWVEPCRACRAACASCGCPG